MFYDRMRSVGGLYVLALVFVSTSLFLNASVLQRWYDRVGHVLITPRLWVSVALVEAWNALTLTYLSFAIRFRFSTQIDIVCLGILCVLGFSAASISTKAGHFEFAQCAGYNRSCAMAIVGYVLNWISIAFILFLLAFKVFKAVFWPTEGALSPSSSNTAHLPITELLDPLPTDKQPEMMV
ncbi:hypothetical protein CcaverHIS631_0402380 [Cutaneotrichosporon cavernicola]|nr:hypothetical protein CcaverHIS631_0402380 [Cutaneotrichosporon cavernicola]